MQHTWCLTGEAVKLFDGFIASLKEPHVKQSQLVVLESSVEIEVDVVS